MKMKKPWLAYLLNVLLPGAGLAYLGKWGWAVMNGRAAFPGSLELLGGSRGCAAVRLFGRRGVHR